MIVKSDLTDESLKLEIPIGRCAQCNAPILPAFAFPFIYHMLARKYESLRVESNNQPDHCVECAEAMRVTVQCAVCSLGYLMLDMRYVITTYRRDDDPLYEYLCPHCVHGQGDACIRVVMGGDECAPVHKPRASAPPSGAPE